MILTLRLNPYVLYCSRASRLGAWPPPAFFGWVDVTGQDVSLEENHTLRGLLRPASLSEHRVRGVHPRCSLCQSFIPFHGCVIFHQGDVLQE